MIGLWVGNVGQIPAHWTKIVNFLLIGSNFWASLIFQHSVSMMLKFFYREWRRNAVYSTKILPTWCNALWEVDHPNRKMKSWFLPIKNGIWAKLRHSGEHPEVLQRPGTQDQNLTQSLSNPSTLVRFNEFLSNL